MNQTENYQLSLWDPEDRIQRTDFNADNAKIEAALAGLDAAIAAGGNCQIYVTSYMGNNKYGAANPTTLTFPHKPILLMTVTANHRLLAFFESNWAYTFVNGTDTAHNLVCSRNGNTVSWYSNSNAVMQMNEGYNYQVVALLDARN